ncbi:uncharacterized protein JN550_013808 [Neoarthrinium moseri]|uniref:uncharacterized protein n=1 Tax=Neoarthrinium moseri TaxID=1658444 RepID=UPI001FDC1631|nr:uncharacterized protein JN550_013808 [Neoarthrinium moseri]KAI1856477.1 hypothetical protein JN550_013808 [Neoarthrinium moseri]
MPRIFASSTDYSQCRGSFGCHILFIINLASWKSKSYGLNLQGSASLSEPLSKLIAAQMPLLRADASVSSPNEKTSEYRLGATSKTSHQSRAKNGCTDLTDREKQQANLVQLGRRKKDSRMFAVMQPLFAQINPLSVSEDKDTTSIRAFLEDVSRVADLEVLARRHADEGKYMVDRNHDTTTIITFFLSRRTVRLIQAKDFDVNLPSTDDESRRAQLAAKEAKGRLGEA